MIAINTSIGFAVELRAPVSAAPAAMVTAGNTGAAWVAAKSSLGMIEGVDRPALAAILPRLDGHTLVLDVGATFDSPAELFDDEFMHIGGDENNGKHWLANPEIVSFMEANGYKEPLELQRYFNERVLEIFTRYGKRMVGWDEILQEGLPTSIVIPNPEPGPEHQPSNGVMLGSWDTQVEFDSVRVLSGGKVVVIDPRRTATCDTRIGDRTIRAGETDSQRPRVWLPSAVRFCSPVR